MSGAASVRDGAVIIAEMLALTSRMLEQRHNADFIVDGVEKRQKLIEEYESFYKKDTASRQAFEKDVWTRQTIAKMLNMDKVISAALAKFRNDAQADIVSNNNQQRVLGYVNTAISASGSYMDYKK